MAGGPGDPLPVQLPTNAPRTAVEDGPGAGSPATHVGDQGGVSGSWLWPGSAPAIGCHLDSEAMDRR